MQIKVAYDFRYDPRSLCSTSSASERKIIRQDFRESIINFTEKCPMGVALIRADRQTADRVTDFDEAEGVSHY